MASSKTSSATGLRPYDGFLCHARRVNDILTHKLIQASDHAQQKHADLAEHSEPSPRPLPRMDFRRIKGNEYGQRQCKGCDQICELLRWGEAQRRRDPEYTGISQSRPIHANYRELDICATVSCCDTCQTLRRAFLLAQVTGLDAARLEDPDKQWPVHAALSMSPEGNSLILAVQGPDVVLFTATAPLREQRTAIPHNPTKGGERIRPDFDKLREVVLDCHENHECSSKHRWSARNPTWLLEILPSNHIRLVRGPADPVDYVVLSYSWGDPACMPAAEWARIKAGGTKSRNGLPVPERLRPFARSHLPEVMQDAISITESLGFHYIWIDNVCIPKGTNWDTEASMMHEVYGNAVFTLVASSSTKATDPLLIDRLAWSQRSKACKLRGRWVCNADMTLDKVRLASAVSQRGWTLQEERLSPRVLYWTGQRWYWSCPERQVAELSEVTCPDTHGEKAHLSLPHRFLEACRSGDDQSLHQEWADIVEAYSRRDLAQPKDRFLAISGLAVRFFNAKAEHGKTRVTEEYLAGLWRDNFAQHLAWAVVEGARSEGNLQHLAPSWSWASLPMCVPTKAKHLFKQSEYFRFISTRFDSATTTDWFVSQLKDGASDFRERGAAIEERGRHVRSVEVQGRFRSFISEGSDKVRWSDVEWKRGDREGFDFRVLSGRHLHARNAQDGRIIAKEAHGGEMVGQLDYLDVIDAGETKRVGVGLPDGAERDLMCLELGELAMLLLQRVPGSIEAYRRVGVCIGYTNRRGFFYGCETRNVLLV